MRKRACVHAVLAIFLGVGLAACGSRQPETDLAPVTATSSPVANASVAGQVVDEFHGFLRFEHLGLEDGLSQSSVNTILQDQQGFLWFGTQDGLDRYDGYTFKVYRPDLNDPNSLSDRWITKLIQDTSGDIWIGTRLGGLNQFDPRTNTFTHFVHDPGDLTSISSDNIFSLLQDSSGNLWIGTEKGLDLYDPQNRTFSHFRHYLPNPEDPNSQISAEVNVIYQDAAGTIWLGTNNGLESFNSTNQLFRTYARDPNTKAIPGSYAVFSIDAAADGGIWVGSNTGLAHFDPVSSQFTQFFPSPSSSGTRVDTNVTAVFDDLTGTVWAGTDEGLIRLDSLTLKTTFYRHNAAILDSLASDRVLSIFCDRGGVLWIGTNGGGVDKYDRGRDKFYYYRNDPGDPNSLSNNNVLHIFIDPSEIAWIGTDGGGLNRFDPVAERFTHYLHDPDNPDSLNSNTVWSVYRDQYGTLWVGTEAGLDQFDEKTGKFLHHVHDSQNPSSVAGNKVVTIGEDRKGLLWIGSNAGLDRFDRLSGAFFHYRSTNDIDQVTQDQVVTFYEDGNSNFWVGTFNKGLYRIDWKTNRYYYYQYNSQLSGSLSNNSVMDITQDRDGNIWVATAGGGLDKYLPATDSFKIYTEADGLPNAVLYSVVEDASGSLWLSTNFGLSRFDPRNEIFRNFSVSDGLQSNEFDRGAYAIGQNGAIYFGGVNGLNVFFADRIQDNKYTPPLVLDSITQDGVPIQAQLLKNGSRSISLNWPKNSFEFELAALSYAEPGKNQYAYMLENFETSWNIIGTNRTGRYTNLPSGTYALKVKASNNDGVWSEPVTAMDITIVPPFWQTWWFRGLAAGLLVLFVFGGYQIRTKSIQHRNQQLERLVQERTREIEILFEKTKELAVIEERNRLARDLHDSAKQKAFAALAQLGTANGTVTHNLAVGKEHIKEAENLVYEVIQELTFLIQEMYPLALKEKGLINSLREYIFEWENRTDIRINFRILDETRLPINIEQALYRIVQESLANVARHSHATRADLSVDYRESDVTVVIADNGCGFDPSSKSSGIGLRLIRERAESIGGQVTIESLAGSGTKIMIRVPHPTDPDSGG